MKPILTSSYQLKPTFQEFLSPAKEFLIKHHVTPNLVTLFSFCSSVILTFGLLWPATRTIFLLLTPLFMLVKISCNALDGMIARETNQQTTLGAWLNEVTDFAADLLVITAIYYLSTANKSWLLLLLLVVLIEATGLLAQLKHSARKHFGPFSKSDRAIYISIVAMALWLSAHTSLIHGLLVVGVMLAIVSWWQQLRYWLIT